MSHQDPSRPPASGEGITTTEHLSAEVLKLREDLSKAQADATVALTEIRQRPTKAQVALGAATVCLVFVTPGAILASGLITAVITAVSNGSG